MLQDKPNHAAGQQGLCSVHMVLGGLEAVGGRGVRAEGPTFVGGSSPQQLGPVPAPASAQRSGRASRR